MSQSFRFMRSCQIWSFKLTYLETSRSFESVVGRLEATVERERVKRRAAIPRKRGAVRVLLNMLSAGYHANCADTRTFTSGFTLPISPQIKTWSAARCPPSQRPMIVLRFRQWGKDYCAAPAANP